MKKIATLISIIIGIAVIGSTIDSRYGLAKIQAEIIENHKIHKLEHKENVLEERLWDLEGWQQVDPTAEREREIKEIKSRLEKVKKQIDKALGLDDD